MADPGNRPKKTWRLRFFLVLATLTLPPAGASAVAVAPGLLDVIATGQCPPAPPDVAAYLCTPWEYLVRMTVGPWALIGHVTLWGAWLGGAALVWVGGRWLRTRSVA